MKCGRCSFPGFSAFSLRPCVACFSLCIRQIPGVDIKLCLCWSKLREKIYLNLQNFNLATLVFFVCLFVLLQDLALERIRKSILKISSECQESWSFAQRDGGTEGKHMYGMESLYSLGRRCLLGSLCLCAAIS